MLLAPEDEQIIGPLSMVPQQQGGLSIEQLPAPMPGAPQVGPMSLAPPPTLEAPYGESEMMNPRRMMWAGLLSDIGSYIGSGGRAPMRGLASQYYMQGEQWNQRAKAANRQAELQNWQNQNQHALNQQRMQLSNLQIGQAQALSDAGIIPGAPESYNQWRAAKTGDSYADWLAKNDTSGLDRQIKQLQIAKGLQDLRLAQNTGTDIDVIKAEQQLSDAYQKDVADQQSVLNQARIALSGLAQGTGVGDIQGTIAFFKTLDPGSVVSSGEQESLNKAGGLISQIQSLLGRAEGGVLGEKGRRELAESMNGLVDLARNDYQTTRGDWSRRISGYGGTVNQENIIGTPLDFGEWDSAYGDYNTNKTDETVLTEEQQDELGSTTSSWLTPEPTTQSTAAAIGEVFDPFTAGFTGGY